MTDNNDYKSELTKGLFGQTDRANGEYHFKSGDVERIYSDAHYVPYGEDASPTRYYQPDRKKPKHRKKGAGFATVVIVCLACALLGGLLGAGLMTLYFDRRVNEVENSVRSMNESSEISTFADTSALASSESIISNATMDTAGNTSLSSEDIYDLASRQVVSITTEYINQHNMPSIVTGSGVVSTSDGMILTNFHVVEKAFIGGYPVNVTFVNEQSYDGQIVSCDPLNDLAVVKINAENLECAVFSADEEIKGGAEITIAGNPFGMFTVSSGKISNPSVDVDAEDTGSSINMFQLDVSVYEGNSGGPVYNSRGEVIGIVTAKVSVNSSDGIGFAIPVKTAEGLYTKSTADVSYKPASLGLEFFKDYDEMFMTYYSYPEGAFVEQVDDNSCSYNAGLKIGDVILEIDGHKILKWDDVSRVLKVYHSGDQIYMLIFRDAQIYSVQLTLD